MAQFIRIAVRNLLKNRNRTLMVGGAVATVSLLLVLLLSVIGGVQKTILSGATALVSGHVNVAGFYKISQSSAAPMVSKFQPILELVRPEVPKESVIIERVKGYGKLISDSSSLQVPIWGVDMQQEKGVLGRLAVIEGNIDELAKTGTMVIFASHAKKLKVKTGDVLTVSMPTYRNISNTKDVRVVAVLRDMGMLSNFSVFMNSKDARDVYQMSDDTTGAIMIFLPHVSQTGKVEEHLRKVIAAAQYPILEKDSQPFWMKFDRISGESWTGQRIDITTWEDETSFMKWILDIFNTITFLLTLILLVIVVLGLMNTLWMSIRERTGEIGTLRAIGMQRRSVLQLFLIESFILSGAGALSGAVLGAFIALALNLLHVPISSEAIQMFLMSNELLFVVKPMTLLFTVFGITLFLTAGALYPSYKASRLKPITAINSIE